MASCISMKEHAVQMSVLKQQIASLGDSMHNCALNLKDEKKRGDELKRRAKTLWAYMPSICFVALRRAHPEAAKWFEEE